MQLQRVNLMKKSMLRNCKACGNDISRYSLFCRNCGHPQGSIVAIWLLVLFLLLLVAYYIAIIIHEMMLVK
jgi:hypothetical protein